jgi:hypothetical protein
MVNFSPRSMRRITSCRASSGTSSREASALSGLASPSAPAQGEIFHRHGFLAQLAESPVSSREPLMLARPIAIAPFRKCIPCFCQLAPKHGAVLRCESHAASPSILLAAPRSKKGDDVLAAAPAPAHPIDCRHLETFCRLPPQHWYIHLAGLWFHCKQPLEHAIHMLAQGRFCGAFLFCFPMHTPESGRRRSPTRCCALQIFSNCIYCVGQPSLRPPHSTIFNMCPNRN